LFSQPRGSWTVAFLQSLKKFDQASPRFDQQRLIEFTYPDQFVTLWREAVNVAVGKHLQMRKSNSSRNQGLYDW
jgi:hypothetical protein